MSTQGLSRVVIVGRPNVGKSTLLNRLRGSRVSIVDPVAGVTRDRVAVPVRLSTEEGVRTVEVVDTGGIGIVDRDDLSADVEDQVQLALAGADLILFLVDARDGVAPWDEEIARDLRRLAIPVLVAVNKVEAPALRVSVEEFRRLGFPGEPLAISAQNGVGIRELIARMVELLPEQPPAPDSSDGSGDGGAEPPMKLAVVGRRNTGKSTLVNAWAGERRVIVSEIPGTTRDSIDVLFERDGERFIAIDTAGIRRKKKLADSIEFYSDARSHRTIRRADVVVLLFDAMVELGAIEKHLGRYIADHYRPVVLAANKCDLLDPSLRPKLARYVHGELAGLSHAPIAFLSAQRGEGVWELLAMAHSLHRASMRRIGTGELNRALERIAERRPPSSKAQQARILYATQVKTSPPTFVLFVNSERSVDRQYLAFVQKHLRSELGFEHVPIRLLVRGRERSRKEETSR